MTYETPSVNEKLRFSNASFETEDLFNRLAANLRARQDRNFKLDCYYDGKRAIRQIGSVIPPQYYRLGLILGWSAKAVDALARRCNLEMFVWPDGDLDSLGAQEIWDQNLLGSEVNQGITSSLLHGPVFTVVTEGNEGEPDVLIHFKDALNATGEWNARRRGLDNLLSVTACDEEGKWSELALYLDGETVTAQRVGGTWTIVDVSEHSLGVPVDMLPYKPRLKRPFGSSRISRPVRALQDRAVNEWARLEGHMDVYSFPEFWMLGADESLFKNSDGSQKASWQIMLGRIKGIPDDEDATNPRADVKQFPASSPEPHLATLNAYAKLFARETSLPDSALAITDVSNPTSAESYDASQYELIAEAEGAADDWSPGLRRTFLRALAAKNGESEIPAEWASIDARWRDPRYQSRAAKADAGSKVIGSVPWLAETEVGLELLGLDDQQIRRALSEKRRMTGSGILQRLTAAAAQVSAQTEPEMSVMEPVESV